MVAIANKVALVTGAAGGIGLAIAQDLAARGARVTVADNDAAAGQAAAAQLPRARFQAADLADGRQCAALVRETVAAEGRIDILVNNAGIQHVAPLTEFPDEMWRRIIDIMLTAPFLLTKAVLPGMYAAGWGRIVNIASVHALRASPFKSAYVAAKHGLIGLTKVTALEGAEHGVTCNAICPGYVWTPLVERQIDDQAKAHGISKEAVLRDVLLAQQPNKKFARVEEIGALAAFLCSDAAAS